MTVTARVMLLAAALVAAAAGSAFAAPEAAWVEPRGPAFGQNRYTAVIQSDDGIPDVDDYVSGLREGEVVSVAVMASRGSTLQPRLELIDPDGVRSTPAVRAARASRNAQFNGFHVTKSGRWTVRVSGANSTTGGYTVAFLVKPTGPVVFLHQQLGEDQPLFKIHSFAGLEGALLDFKLTWSAHGLPVSLRSLMDPSGAEVRTPGGDKVAGQVTENTRRRTLNLSSVALHDGDGDYSFRVRTPQGAARYDATLVITPVGRPKGRKPVVLTAKEPFLEIRSSPQPGRPDSAVRLSGRNFATDGVPRVYFGRAEGGGVTVAPDGSYLDVVVPAGVPGTAVAVAVVNPDGQASVRGAYFFYLQPIKVTDLLDENGDPARNASTRGGKTLRLVGEFFATGQTVLFGNSVARLTTLLSATEMLVVTPASPPGVVSVVLRDTFGGEAVAGFTFRYKTPPTFDPSPYSPSVTAVGVPVLVTVKGRDFEAVDQLTFDGAPLTSAFLGSTRRTFSVPSLPAGSYSVTLTDAIGTVERGPDFVVKPPPSITAVRIIAGPRSGANGIPASGGSTVEVDGTNFHVTDVLLVGATQAGFLAHTPMRFTFAAPAGPLGAAALTVTDGAGQRATLANAIRYVGYSDATGSRSPGASSLDSLVAARGAVGDLDVDGRADDLVIVNSYSSVGTRTENTRIFFGDANGNLIDRTLADFPGAGTDSSAADLWNASAVVIGDVDRGNGADVLIGANPAYSYYGGVYNGVRLFRNDGRGKFTQDETSAPPSAYAPAVFAYDPTGASYLVYGTVFDAGTPTAMALGDLDRDGDADLVIARSVYQLRYVGIDPAFVNFAATPPTVATANVSYLSYFQYGPGTRTYDNDIAHARGFVETSNTALPSAGTSRTPPVPSFHARDLVLGDLDKDGDLDIVLTWDDPTTVSAFGRYSGSNVDTPRVATRVLLNGGSGRFTDATATWLPAGATPEFWQGRRLALFDLDKDSDLDLVILHDQGTDAFNTKPPAHTARALRILRNDGASTGFVNATASALPALPGNGDDFRGEALAVRDVDSDGWPDIVIGTTEVLADSGGAPLHSTRLFRGATGLKFTLDTLFLPSLSVDTGETTDILVLGDLSGTSDPSLLFLSTVVPAKSTNGDRLRVLDWNR